MTTMVEFLVNSRERDPVPSGIGRSFEVPSVKPCVAKTMAKMSMQAEQEIAPDIRVGRRPHLSIYKR